MGGRRGVLKRDRYCRNMNISARGLVLVTLNVILPKHLRFHLILLLLLREPYQPIPYMSAWMKSKPEVVIKVHQAGVYELRQKPAARQTPALLIG